RKSQGASVIGIDREGVAGNERDSLLQRDVEQRPRTHVPRQAHPEVKAALGIVPGDARPGKLAGERGASSVLLLAVELAQPSDVRFGTTAPVKLQDDPLRERAGARVHRLLRSRHARDDIRIGDDPTDAEAGQEGLRERPDRHDVGATERSERRQVLAAKAQRTVRIVLDHDRFVARSEREERLAALERERLAGGVLEVGDDEEHAWPHPELSDAARRFRDVEAVRVHGHLEDTGAVVAEGRKRVRERGRLGDDDIAWTEVDPSRRAGSGSGATAPPLIAGRISTVRLPRRSLASRKRASSPSMKTFTKRPNSPSRSTRAASSG